MVRLVHSTAREKGWYDRERTSLEVHMLMVSELAEATEQARKDMPPLYVVRDKDICQDVQKFEAHEKPEGEAVELADAIIRIADYFGYRGWDLQKVLQMKMEFNKNRPYRHGHKKY